MAMNLDIDSSTILYGFGALFGTAAVLYFSREIILELSPTVKSLLLLGGFATLLLGGMHMGRAVLQKTMYVLSSASYLAFLVYTIGVFGFSTEQVFLALGLSSILFIGLGYLIRERGAVPEPGTARKAVIGLVIIGLLLVAVDVIGPQPSYDASFVDEVNASVSGPVTVGAVTVENDFIFSRSVDVPRYQTCIYLPERRPTFTSTVDAPSIISGRSSATVDLTARIPVRRVNDSIEEPGLGVIPVERMGECPETSETAKIVVAGKYDGREILRRELG